jgi:two-component system probable response regulator PhcQ
MKHTVLLLDDEPHVLHALVRLLRKESYEIVTASSAEEAARILDSRPVDLIVSDEQMPGMSGTEFLAKVADEFPNVVRIILTGHATVPTAIRAINDVKVQHFFTKPCNEVDLALAIRKALQEKDRREAQPVPAEPHDSQVVLADTARIVRRLRESTEGQPDERGA